MAKIQLTVTANSKDLGEENYDKIYDMSANGIDLYPKMDQFPMPWDAACYIEGEMFILDGDLGQQGSHRGYATVGLPLNKVMNYLDLFVVVDEEYEAEVRAIFQEYGWL